MIVNPEFDADQTWALTRFVPSKGQIIAICDRCATMLARPCALRNSAGRVITVGADCAMVLCSGGSLAQVKKMVARHERELREARKVKKLEATRRRNQTECAGLLARLDVLSGRAGFAGQFGADVAKRMREGKQLGLSERQLALIEKLEKETAGCPI